MNKLSIVVYIILGVCIGLISPHVFKNISKLENDLFLIVANLLLVIAALGSWFAANQSAKTADQSFDYIKSLNKPKILVDTIMGHPGEGSCTVVLVNYGSEMIKIVNIQIDTIKNATREIKSMKPVSILQKQYEKNQDPHKYLDEYKVSFPLYDADIHNKKITGAKLRMKIVDFAGETYGFEYDLRQEEHKLGSKVIYMPIIDLGSGRYTKG